MVKFLVLFHFFVFLAYNRETWTKILIIYTQIYTGLVTKDETLTPTLKLFDYSNLRLQQFGFHLTKSLLKFYLKSWQKNKFKCASDECDKKNSLKISFLFKSRLWISSFMGNPVYTHDYISIYICLYIVDKDITSGVYLYIPASR